MRVGENPIRDQIKKQPTYTHQVVLPVYIPKMTDYYKDSLAILKLCVDSLLKTVHKKTFISLVNNGCCLEVQNYLQSLYDTGSIHEVVHTGAIGKLNAIRKGIGAHDFELVTVSDADILFLNGWQDASTKTFNAFPKAGVVGIIPQFKTYTTYSYNLLFDTFWSKKVRFTPVPNPDAMKAFYKSLGWDTNYDQSLLESHLTITAKNNTVAIIGSGHCVATYRNEVIRAMPQEVCDFSLGGESENYYLDTPVLKLGGWRLTTENNYGYHLGNGLENWMKTMCDEMQDESNREILKVNQSSFSTGKVTYFVKNKVFKKVLKQPKINRCFLNKKKL